MRYIAIALVVVASLLYWLIGRYLAYSAPMNSETLRNPALFSAVFRTESPRIFSTRLALCTS